ncbi:MAG: thiamine phosphate synthase [Micropruina sp.]|uniref:thiamine phosphate synthase n=1 Tax=Micropruina sp. TaxID=2737536 RepID=UPI0039E28994
MTILRGLDVRLRLARLFCVTDARLRTGDLPGFAAGVLDAGVDLVQLRDEAASDAEKLAALETLRAADRGRGLVSVYADPALAREFGADVLQLPKGGPDPAKARRYVSRWALLGRPCYTIADLDAAFADDGIDFVTLGPVYARLPWSSDLPGLDLVRHAARVAPPATPGSKPWFAIGGITADNLGEVLAAGARRVAVGRAITAAAEPARAARGFADRLRAAWGDEFDAFTLDALR